MGAVAPEARCDFTTFGGTGRAFVRRLLPALFLLEWWKTKPTRSALAPAVLWAH